jgi:primosomal protein N' (replication factor Y)
VDGGRCAGSVDGADASLPLVQALIRWDPVGHAAAELAARRELGFPPAVAMASVEGTEEAVLPALDRLEIPPDGEMLGPVALDELEGWTAGPPKRGGDDEEQLTVRALIRAPQAQRKVLGAALRALAAGRSARKEGGGLRIRVDPVDLF